MELTTSKRQLSETSTLTIQRLHFSSAHFLSLPDRNDAENVRLFGPSSNTWAHGHNYTVEIGVSGTRDPLTGMLLHAEALPQLLHRYIVEPLDFKNLNRQVPFFENRLTTLENIGRFIWRSTEKPLEGLAVRPVSLRVLESPDLWVDYFGGSPTPGDHRPALFLLNDIAENGPLRLKQDTMDTDMQTEREMAEEAKKDWVYLSRCYAFAAGHTLSRPDLNVEENKRLFGRCHNPNGHGHTYELEITVAGQPDERMGMVTDLFALDQLVQRVILDRVDHRHLNTDVDFMADILPTCENTVRALWRELAPEIPPPAYLLRLRLWETRERAVEYAGDKRMPGSERAKHTTKSQSSKTAQVAAIQKEKKVLQTKAVKNKISEDALSRLTKADSAPPLKKKAQEGTTPVKKRSAKSPVSLHGPLGTDDMGKVVEILAQTYPTHPMGLLTEGQPYKVLIACLLSLRTRDDVSIPASKRLFSVADTPEGMVKQSPEAIERLIQNVGFHKTKTRTLLDISQKLLDDFNGQVPDTIEELLTFKGVGRKTANLVVGLGFGLPAVCVDTHVHRITNRLGYLVTRTPDETEMGLRERLPAHYWLIINKVMVRHGQEICKPIGPRCDECPVRSYCHQVGVKPRAVKAKGTAARLRKAGFVS